jgi:hypothetical protein
VNRGTFGLYTEMAAADDKFLGYVKPVIKDLKVVGPQDRNDTFLQQVWEHVIGFVGVIFRNQPHDQLATKIPIEGSFINPSIGTLDAIIGVLKNAFIQALIPSIDHEINLNAVEAQPAEKKNFLQKVFGKKKPAETK